MQDGFYIENKSKKRVPVGRYRKRHKARDRANGRSQTTIGPGSGEFSFGLVNFLKKLNFKNMLKAFKNKGFWDEMQFLKKVFVKKMLGMQKEKSGLQKKLLKVLGQTKKSGLPLRPDFKEPRVNERNFSSLRATNTSSLTY